MKKKQFMGKVVYHAIVLTVGLVMIYPLVWMIMSSFKETNSIFATAGNLIPEKFVLESELPEIVLTQLL